MNKFSKGTIKSNILESLENLGRDTARGSFEAIKKTFNPLELMNKENGMENNKEKNHTQLDFEKLQKQYDDKDKVKLNAYRQKLFQLVKSGEEKALNESRQQKDQKEKHEVYQKQQEDQKKKQTAIRNEAGPVGKQRRSILGGGKRKANVQLEQSVEYKQNAGK